MEARREADREREKDKRERKHKKEKKEKKEKKDKRNKKDKKRHEYARVVNDEKLDALHSYMAKQHEFALWLREERNVYPDDVTDTQSLHRLFALFVREWNNGTLPARYAAGITLAAAARTAYRWPFVDKLDPVRLGHVVDEVDRATHADSVIRVAASETKKSAPAATGAAGGDLSIDNSSKKRKEKGKSDSEDSEERRWREKDAKKKDVKAFAKRKDAVMEELAPKPTGKDAQLEKKKQESAYHRKADDDAQADLEAFDPYGEGPSIKARIAREREQRQRNADAKLDSYHKALADYKAREDAKMAQFKAMLGSNSGAGGGFASGGTQRFGI